MVAVEAVGAGVVGVIVVAVGVALEAGVTGAGVGGQLGD